MVGRRIVEGYLKHRFQRNYQFAMHTFEIVEGRLYVNKNLAVYKRWKKDVPGNIVKAEGKWIDIKGVAADEL